MEKTKRPRKSAKPARKKKKDAMARRSPVAIDGDVSGRDRPTVDRLLRLLRSAVGALLDVADAAAGAITKRTAP